MKKLLMTVLSMMALVSPALPCVATFSRIKTWSNGDTLTAGDLNSEYNNILNNLNPTGICGDSEDLTTMQGTASPYPGSVASLATSVKGELERLRYQILGLKQAMQATSNTYWYEALPTAGVFTISGSSIGINNTNPTVALDVVGAVKISTLAAVSSATISGLTVTTITFSVGGSSITGIATQAQMEAGTSSQTIVTPAMFSSQGSAAKAWAIFVGTDASPTVLAAYGLTSVAKNSTGNYSLTFAKPFSSTAYACVTTAEYDGGTAALIAGHDTDNPQTTTVYRLQTARASTETVTDSRRVTVICFGDQ